MVARLSDEPPTFRRVPMDGLPPGTPSAEMKAFLLVVRRALLLVVGYIELVCGVGSKRR